MNWKKLIIGITIVNAIGWLLLELWSARYADSNIDAGAGWMIAIHLLGYYIIVIGSKIPSPEPKKEPISPVNCPSHDWQTQKYSNDTEVCVKCGAERGKN